jgi:hypothetical protein
MPGSRGLGQIAQQVRSVVEGTYSMGIDKPGDQELSSRQTQRLELSTVTDRFQECADAFRRYRRARWDDLLDGLDETVLADIEESAGENFVGALVDGGNESADDKERHMTIWDNKLRRNEAEVEMRNDGGGFGAATELGKSEGSFTAGTEGVDILVPVWV